MGVALEPGTFEIFECQRCMEIWWDWRTTERNYLLHQCVW